jgi:dTMP kinase
MKNKGLLITLEGIDGCGKTTLARSLAHLLTEQKHAVFLTKEPGGTVVGKQLRAMVQTQSVPLTPKTEFLLFAADRAQHFHDCIIPYLATPTIIISDRMADSSLVYQGFGRGLEIETLHAINRWVMNGITPDLTFYLSIPYEVARKRLTQERTTLTAFEKEKEAFTQKLIMGYEELFDDKKHVVRLDGTLAPETIALQALQAVTALIEKIGFNA